MGTKGAKARPKTQSIHAVITRADGRVENLGVISYWHRNPLMRMAHRLRVWIMGNNRR